jgi:nicotinate-nucleotide--dimethylbenzimidazole phosphoribosyltransferase
VDRKTKPPGSLGRLEELAVDIATWQGSLTPAVDPVRLVIFAADHGITAEGVSAYPAEVTAQMMANFAGGGAAACVLARSAGVQVEVVDVGVAADLAGLPGIVHAKVRHGTRSFLHEPAMTEGELNLALEAGRAAARRAQEYGCRVMALGEMGIGNTTSAAALLGLLTGQEALRVVGRGTGVDDDTLLRKREVVRLALERHAGNDAPGALAAVGGFEIAAMAGAMSAAATHGMLVLVDGFIATVAALAAVREDPSCRGAMIFAHRSAEHGHAVALDHLGARPLLDLGLRLGEGTGALLAVPLVRAAAAMLSEMATFESAGIAGPVDG